MSLKAKLEAVIYAAEEPVTLAQLAALFAAEALEWKAEQVAAQPSEIADETLFAEEIAEPTFQAPTEIHSEATQAVQNQDTSEVDSESTPGAPGLASETGDTLNPGPESATPAPETESELKRQARQQDREVRAILRQILDQIIADCATDGRGVEIREIAGGYRMATKPECHDAVRLFVKSLKPPLKLSLAALETLAVIAYKQPVTAPEVSEIRGVEAGGVIGSLLSRKLIATAGRKQVIGRPMLYKTTKEFLLRFGLKDVAELPSMEEFEKMAASELDEIVEQDETAEAAPPEDLSAAMEQDDAEAEEHSPEAAEFSPINDLTVETTTSDPEPEQTAAEATAERQAAQEPATA